MGWCISPAALQFSTVPPSSRMTVQCHGNVKWLEFLLKNEKYFMFFFLPLGKMYITKTQTPSTHRSKECPGLNSPEKGGFICDRLCPTSSSRTGGVWVWGRTRVCLPLPSCLGGSCLSGSSSSSSSPSLPSEEQTKTTQTWVHFKLTVRTSTLHKMHIDESWMCTREYLCVHIYYTKVVLCLT